MDKIYSESIFVDSGAHGLYNIHVLKYQEKTHKKTGKRISPLVRWSQGDFSYYSLKKGSAFRAYCDRYAQFMKEMRSRDPSILLANIDVISNPDMTWQVQRYLEDAHGVIPVPIIHYGTEMRHVDRYLGRSYDLLGVGGLGQGVSRHEYFGWADKLFVHICPSPDRLPIIKTHGFAMTSWELMCRYPWWSVDSATWVKLSAYGWIYIPRLKSRGYSFDRPPLVINFSFRSPQQKIPKKHYTNLKHIHRETVRRWLESINIPFGSVDAEGNLVEFGIVSHHRARAIANLCYLSELERSRPSWPHPLDENIVDPDAPRYRKGFGMSGALTKLV